MISPKLKDSSGMTMSRSEFGFGKSFANVWFVKDFKIIKVKIIKPTNLPALQQQPNYEVFQLYNFLILYNLMYDRVLTKII